MTFGFRVGSRNADGRKDWKVYYDNSILANGPEMQQLIEKAKEQGIYAELDMQKVPARKMEHDVCGHYARPDVLKLQVEDK